MENQKLLDVVALAAQLQAVACEESGILSVSYDKYGTHVDPFTFRPSIFVHVSSPEMVDAVSRNAILRPFSDISLKYCAEIQDIEVFAIVDIKQAMNYTGKNCLEIARIMAEDH